MKTSWVIRGVGRAAALVAVLVVASWTGAVSAADETVTPKATHVVVVVFDGLRPDSVTAQDTPTLFKMAQTGTVFAHHHPVYLSSTEVNGSAIATGGYPGHDGIMANAEYRPGIELMKPIGTESVAAVRKGDELTKGQFLRMPTTAEILRGAGRTTVIAGTKPVALLLDRAARTDAGSPTLYAGHTLPENLVDTIVPVAGKFPPVADATVSANARQDAWTTRVLINRLWAGGVPAFTTLWLSEPDFAQHGSGPGSATAKAALRSSDNDLAAVLAALEAAKVRDQTDVFVVSDHGFSTISRTVDPVELLNAAGFTAVTQFKDAPGKGNIVVVGEGGSACLYVIGHDAATTRRLVEFLQTSDFAGPIFCRDEAPGTFTLKEGGIETAEAPDVVVSMRWTNDQSATGMPGEIVSIGRKPGQGNHASLSPWDMHNTLIGVGPDIRVGFVSEWPSGNSDIAPTVLWILGAKAPEEMDGRVLREAMAGAAEPTEKPVARTREASAVVQGAQWEQFLRETQFEGVTYYDEGSVEQQRVVPAARP